MITSKEFKQVAKEYGLDYSNIVDQDITLENITIAIRYKSERIKAIREL